MAKRLTNEEFLEKVQEKHGNKYEILTEYVNTSTPIQVKCNACGEVFSIRPNNLLSKGQGCLKCAKKHPNKPYTIDEWIEKCKMVHNGKYSYNKDNLGYINNNSKVNIHCSKHGWFTQLARNHMSGCGCKECAKEKNMRETRINCSNFTEKARKVHGSKYTYFDDYVNSKTKIKIQCNGCGEVFYQTPHCHLQGKGCPKCNGGTKMTLDTFLEKARRTHGNTYDYNKVVYDNCLTEVCIICPIHGEFWQTPHSHLNGCGCPKCKQSKLEKTILNLLQENKIKFECQKKFKWLGRQSLDFYLPQYNIAIECQGEQHFKPVEYFGGKEKFKTVTNLDHNKYKICSEKKVRLLYYSNIQQENYFSKIFINAKDLLKEIQKCH